MYTPNKVYILFQAEYEEPLMLGVYYSMFLCTERKKELENLCKNDTFYIKEYKITK